MKAALLILALILAVNPQTRRKTPQRPEPTKAAQGKVAPLPVTVRLKSGAEVIGEFISASNQTLTVMTDGSTKEIQLTEVLLIEFGSAGVSQSNEAARVALKALRQLESAVMVGLTFREYGSRLIDAKIAIDEALRQIHGEAARSAVTLAMNDYQVAANVWERKIRGRAALDPNSDYYKSLLKVYPDLISTGHVDVVTGQQIHISTEEVLTVIWKSATVRIEKLAQLLS